MTSPDQKIAYLSKRKKKVLSMLAEIRRLSLSHSNGVVSYSVELILSKDKKGKKNLIINLEDDHILDIFQEFNFLKKIDNYPDSENNQIYELEIDQKQFNQSEIFLLRELDLANSSQVYNGDPIASIVIKLDNENKMSMRIFINNSESFDFEVNKADKNWKLLYEVAKNKSIVYDDLKYKNPYYYLNNNKECIFYSKDKFKPTKILKRQHGNIVACIPIKIQK
jgi:hypothetical protein